MRPFVEMKKYLVIKPYKSIFNRCECTIPAGVELEQNYYHGNNILTYAGNFVCMTHSQNSHEHVVGNDDKKGIYRHRLITEINKRIVSDGKKTTAEQIRREIALNRLWEDKRCMRYNRSADEPGSPWLWTDEFYCAAISDLEYILYLIEKK